MPADARRLTLISRRLRIVAAGSRLADEAIHAALGREGYPPPYSTVDSAAADLVPEGYEVTSIYLKYPTTHAMCWRGEDRHAGQGNSAVLARLSVILAARAAQMPPTPRGSEDA
jgi:hypothetical protein